MKKVTVGAPMLVAQSTEYPILFGGYQIPFIRIADDGTIYVRFNSRTDHYDTHGLEEANPVFSSTDGGITWNRVHDAKAFSAAQKALPNGDVLEMRETPTITNIDDEILKHFPPISQSRKDHSCVNLHYDLYTVEELASLFGDQLKKEFICNRKYAGTDKAVEESCTVNWDNMPVMMTEGKSLVRICCTCHYDIDPNGTLWMPVYGGATPVNGETRAHRYCTHLLRSDDFGHTWDYVNSIEYVDDIYNTRNECLVEGFNECALTCLDDGAIIMVLRSGSLHPFEPYIGSDDRPAPRMFIAKTRDGGKTFDFVKPFCDYGIRPVSVRLPNGTIVLASGRPGVNVRICDDPLGENWSEPIAILTVPKEKVYTAYWKYSCSNCDLAIYNDNTVFLTYSDFTKQAPNGKIAKSIFVRKLTIEDIGE